LRSTGFDQYCAPCEFHPATMSFFEKYNDDQLSATGPETSAVGSACLMAAA
jgi:hypothetical protein